MTLMLEGRANRKGGIERRNKMNLTPRAEGPDQDAGTENLIGGL